jgi:histone H3/H4
LPHGRGTLHTILLSCSTPTGPLPLLPQQYPPLGIFSSALLRAASLTSYVPCAAGYLGEQMTQSPFTGWTWPARHWPPRCGNTPLIPLHCVSVYLCSLSGAKNNIADSTMAFFTGRIKNLIRDELRDMPAQVEQATVAQNSTAVQQATGSTTDPASALLPPGSQPPTAIQPQPPPPPAIIEDDNLSPSQKPARITHRKQRRPKVVPNTEKPCIPRAPFKRLVRNIIKTHNASTRISETAIAALHELTELYMASAFEDAGAIAARGRRVTVFAADMQVARDIRNPRGWTLPLPNT